MPRLFPLSALPQPPIRAASAVGLGLLASALAARQPAAGLWAAGLALIPCLWLAQVGARMRTDALAALGLTALSALSLSGLALLEDPYRDVSNAQFLTLVSTGTAFAAFFALGWLAADLAMGRFDTPARPRPAGVAPPRWLRTALVFCLGATAVALPLSIAGMQICLGLCAGLLLVGLVIGATPRAASPLDGPVLALLCAALGSSALSPHPALLTTTALRAIAAFFVVSRALDLAAPSREGEGEGLERRLIGLWAGAAAFGAALAFLQHWSGFDLTATLGFRPVLQVAAPGDPGRFAGMGTLNSRLTFAHVTLLPAAALAGLWVAGALPKRERWAAALALALCGLGLWSSFARGAWFALGVSLLALLVLAGAARSLRRGLPAALGVLALAAVFLWFSPAARARAASGLSLQSNRDRLFLWARGAEIVADHPVVGVGFGSYASALGPYYDRLEPSFVMRTWAHDMPLSLWAEAGPLGLFAYLWLFCAVVGLVLTGLRASTPTRRGLLTGAGLGACAFFVVALFHDALYDGEVAYNLIFGLGLSAVAFAREPARGAKGAVGPRPPVRFALAANRVELWQYRALIWALATRELKARYRGSVLGFLWTFVNPLLLMTVYLLVFGVFLKQQMEHYTFYMFVGLLPWMWFSTALSQGTASLASKRDLLTRVKFPPQVLPTVVVFSELINYLLALPLMIGLALATGAPLHWTVVFFPVVVFLQFAFTLGLVYATSALNVFFRDLQHVVVNLTTLWFFLIPVIYERTVIPAPMRELAIGLDPMAVFVTAYQDLWFYGVPPNPVHLAIALGMSLVLLSLAAQTFDARRDEFAEVV